MSEFELIQAQRAFADSGSAMFMNFVTILSGYLIAAHYIGAQLTKAQFYVMNALYLVVTIAITVSAYNLTTNAVRLSEYLAENEQTVSLWWPAGGGPPGIQIVIVMLLMLSGSIYFSITARNKK